VAVVCLAALPACAPAGATLEPSEAQTYLPFGFVHDRHAATLATETLGQLDGYGIGQALLPLKKLRASGRLELSRTERTMLGLWVAQTGAYDREHGGAIALWASFSGKVKGRSLNLEDAAVRGRIVAGAETVLAMGAQGLSLDLEPYPTSPGFLALLGELDAMLARRGFAGRLATVAPATLARWPAQYTREVTALVSQVDPLFYDSERKSAASYEQWVREGLAFYTANSAAGTRIVPDLPSYGPNRWHDPAVENLATATSAIEAALLEGSRVDGAGIFWWWGFFYDEEGEGSYEAAPDRETWQTRTRAVAFTP
jgi:hypothetical protein